LLYNAGHSLSDSIEIPELSLTKVLVVLKTGFEVFLVLKVLANHFPDFKICQQKIFETDTGNENVKM
jgi:hypothetical protein